MDHAPAHGTRTAGERLALLQEIACAADRVLRARLDTPDSCIAGAAIVRDVARTCGISALVIPTRVAIWNGVWIDFVSRTGRAPETVAESEALLERGGWCVGIGAGYLDERDAPFGFRPERGSYNGHLVTVVEGRWLVDCTLGQAADPEHGIVTGPLVVELGSSGFLMGRGHLASRFRWGTHPIVHVTYEGVPHDRSYRDAPAWRAPERRELAEAVLRALGNVAA